MGLFDIFKRQAPLPAALPDALIEAAYRKDSKALASLCAQHREEIHRCFPEWKTVPAHVRQDAAARDKFCRGLVAVAAHFENLGDPSLIKLLMGNEADNPLLQWQRDLTEAQALLDSGRATDAVALLHKVIERTQGLAGDGVTEYMPKTFGSLGAAYFRAGDKSRAIEFTERALELCRQNGDEEGVKIYLGNIEHIDNAP